MPADVPQAGQDRFLRRLVDGGRLVTAAARPDHRLALGARRQPLERRVDVLDRRAAQLEPVGHSASGSISRPDVSLG